MDEYACGGSPCLDSTTTTRLGTNSCHGQMPGFDPNDVFSDLEPFPEVAAFSDCTTSSPDLLVLPELHPVPSVSFCSTSAIAASNEKTRREARKVKNQKLHSATSAVVSARVIAASQMVSTALKEL